MSYSEYVQGRLYNWKFESAREGLDDLASPQERVLIESLAKAFGNPGWFTGSMAVIIEIALEHIGIDSEKL